MAELIDGAMQHAPQWERHAITACYRLHRAVVELAAAVGRCGFDRSWAPQQTGFAKRAGS
jgi:hypothetical protein